MTNKEKEAIINNYIQLTLQDMTVEQLRQFYYEKTFNKLYVMPVDALKKELAGKWSEATSQ
jgi:hypothetical protein